VSYLHSYTKMVYSPTSLMNIPKKSIGHLTQYLHYPQFSTLIPGVNVFPLWCRRLTKSLWSFLLVSIYSTSPIPCTFHWTSNSHGMVVLHPFHPGLDVLWTFHHFCKLLRPNWWWWCNWCLKWWMSAIIEHDEIHFYCLVAIVLNCSNITAFSFFLVAHIWNLSLVTPETCCMDSELTASCSQLSHYFQIQGHLSQQWLTPLWKWIHLGYFISWQHSLGVIQTYDVIGALVTQGRRNSE